MATNAYEDPTHYNPADAVYWLGFSEYWLDRLVLLTVTDLLGNSELCQPCVDLVFILLRWPSTSESTSDIEKLVFGAVHDAAVTVIAQHRWTLLVNSAQFIVRNRFDAEDAAQEALVTLTRGAWMLRGNLDGYLRTIARSKALDLVRKRRPTDPLDLERATWADSDPSCDPQTALELDEEQNLIAYGLSKLLPKDLHVVQRYAYGADEPTLRTIGDELGKKAEATKKVWDRALVKLEHFTSSRYILH
jgi:RNA polymerase sigma factor (sigma-70 family)